MPRRALALAEAQRLRRCDHRKVCKLCVPRETRPNRPPVPLACGVRRLLRQHLFTMAVDEANGCALSHPFSGTAPDESESTLQRREGVLRHGVDDANVVAHWWCMPWSWDCGYARRVLRAAVRPCC